MGWIVLIIILVIIGFFIESVAGKTVIVSLVIAGGCFLLSALTGFGIFIIIAKVCLGIAIIALVWAIIAAVMGV